MNYVFLSYINRSGSTYLANLLSRSAEICVCPEADILYELFLTDPSAVLGEKKKVYCCRILSNNAKLQLWKIDPEGCLTAEKTCFENFLAILNRFQEIHYPQATHILFKQNYLLDLADIYKSDRYFWINLIRDPRSVYISQKNTISPNTLKPMNRNILAFTEHWNLNSNKLIRMKDCPGVITICYENLITNFNKVMIELTTRLHLIIRWEGFVNNKSQLMQWISPEYCEIHPYIDDFPKFESIDKWQAMITKTELEFLQNNISQNMFYPGIKPPDQGKKHVLHTIILRIDRKIEHMKIVLIKKLRYIFYHV